ncbi:PAS domain-containing hybrid sensor histidine kinase/response regulator [Ideonella livida]|uniref:Sensory/regulatory protein RpfC n=1 Tax=Ideonella livida TaxID=2707176 RepID=A0A7C9PEE6_9BURK|nr:ATP-binding protein [Ideonella livida]NDY89793.1 response regulator [Ideonella livida]
MSDSTGGRTPAAQRRWAGRVALAFGVGASAWVLLSDLLLDWLVDDPGVLAGLDGLTDWLAVAGVTLGLYLVLRRPQAAAGAEPAGRVPVVRLPLAMAVLAVGVAAAATIALALSHHQALQRLVPQLQDYSGQQAQQVAGWLADRVSQAEFVRGSTYMADLHRDWQGGGSPQAAERLMARLVDARTINHLQDVTLLDGQGRVLLREVGSHHELSEQILTLVRQAALDGQTRLSGLRTDGHGGLDLVVPLVRTGQPAGAVALFHAVLPAHLLPARAVGPGGGLPVHTELLRVEGGQVVRPGQLPAALAAQPPLWLPGRVARGELALGEVREGHDQDRQPVRGLVTPLAGTDWWLLTSVREADLWQGVLHDAVALAAAVLAAMLCAGIAVFLLRERRALARAEAQNQQQETELRNLRLLEWLAGSSTDILFAQDTAGRYLLFNAAGARLAGRPAESVIGQDDTHLLPPVQAAQLRAEAQAVMRDGGQRQFEFTLPLADGLRTFHTTLGPLLDGQGRLMGVAGIARDVTAQREDERRLTDNAELLGAMSRLAKIGGWRFDLVSGVGHATEEVNRIADLSPGAPFTGQMLETLYQPEGMAATREAVARAVRLREPYDLELPLADHLGPNRWVRTAGLPVVRGERVVALQGFTQEITEQRRLRLELEAHRHHLEELVAQRTAQLAEARERAEAANRAKTTFLANMSHEIRTPMNAILGLTRLLRRSAVNPQQADRLDKVNTAARHLLAVLNDILDLSKIEAGRVELEGRDFCLQALLDEVQALLGPQAAAKGLRLRVEPAPPGQPLHGDPTRLRQMLLNLVSNAVKFTDRGEVCLRALAGPVQADGHWLLRLEVQDTGMGVAESELPRLFSPFEQADSSITRQHGGTGLGLAITRKLAQLMGGDAGASSQPGQGSTFWFSVRLRTGSQGLPARLPTGPLATAEQAVQQLLARQPPARVLLVEDNPVNREVTQDLLADFGVQVETAADGRQALALLARLPVDLVLMDMQMPVLDGLATTRALRGPPLQLRLPVLGLTANAFAEDRQACLAAGMDGFMTKPVDPDLLATELLRWLPGAHAPAVPPPDMPPGMTMAATPGRDRAVSLSAAETAAPALPDPVAGGARPPPAWRGVQALSWSRGLAHCGGRVDLLLRVLRAFRAHHAEDGPRLRAALAAADGEGLLRLAHALKGAAGTVGAEAVQQAAGRLQLLCETAPEPRAPAATPGVPEAVATLEQCLQQLLDQLAVADAAAPEPPAPGVS